MLGTLGEKVGMTQYFTESGASVGATVLRSDPAVVVQVKTLEKDDYKGVQLGYKDTEKRKLTKPMKGHFEKYGVQPKKYLVEYRVDNPEDYSPGDEVTVEQFQPGDTVDVTGNSKGKGFQGVVKRWGFSGGPKTHGSRFHRKPGSIGMCVEPGRVLKGKKLPGRTGNETVTIRNLKVLKASPEDDILVLKGSVPGPRDNLIQIRSSND
ncbi:MAG: 50S ribosomal protein L3 [Candidatus Bipolaricaulia bacterium]